MLKLDPHPANRQELRRPVPHPPGATSVVGQWKNQRARPEGSEQMQNNAYQSKNNHELNRVNATWPATIVILTWPATS